MNPLLCIAVAPLAMLGTVLIAAGTAGWGSVLIGLAIAVGQTPFLIQALARNKRQKQWKLRQGSFSARMQPHYEATSGRSSKNRDEAPKAITTPGEQHRSHLLLNEQQPTRVPPKTSQIDCAELDHSVDFLEKTLFDARTSGR